MLSTGQKLENNGISVAPPPPLHVSDVPPPPQHQGSGGSASLQPRRTPVTDREIEAILVSKKNLKTLL